MPSADIGGVRGFFCTLVVTSRLTMRRASSVYVCGALRTDLEED